MHFTRLSAYEKSPVPMIVRGEGAYVFDVNGKRYLDGLSGLFVVQAGHGRQELADAAAKQAAELAYFPLWSYAHPKAVELADRLADFAPGDLNRVFFTTGGSEAVESAWKLARSYFKHTGRPTKYKVISRHIAYHGTSMGALSITGLPGIKADFEPLVPAGVRVPNTNLYRAPAGTAGPTAPTPRRSAGWAADRIEEAIVFEGPETVAAVFLEPVQNSGGCFPPPPGYFQRVREICDRLRRAAGLGRGHLRVRPARRVLRLHPVRLPARHHHLRQGDHPRLRAAGRDDRLRPAGRAVPATAPTGSPTASRSAATRWRRAVALANLDIFEREDLNGHVRANEAAFRSTLERLRDLPIVGDVRGDGYFYGIELVKDKATKETFDDDESERAAARVPVQGALRRRALLPRRRPGRSGRATGAAADLRRDPLHRDRADPAVGADRGLVPDLTPRSRRVSGRWRWDHPQVTPAAQVGRRAARHPYRGLLPPRRRPRRLPDRLGQGDQVVRARWRRARTRPRAAPGPSREGRSGRGRAARTGRRSGARRRRRGDR